MNTFGFTIPVDTTSVLDNLEYDSDYKTVVVLGLGQGGTSMICAVVNALGITFGEADTRFGNFEYLDMPNVSSNREVWFEDIRRANERANVWGFKYHYTHRYSPEDVHPALRNPYYVVVVKDIFSIAQRRLQRVPIDRDNILKCLLSLTNEYRLLWDWIYKLPPTPLLVTSYQRAITNPRDFVGRLSSFLRLTPTELEIERSVARISPSGGYLTTETQL